MAAIIAAPAGAHAQASPSIQIFSGLSLTDIVAGGDQSDSSGTCFCRAILSNQEDFPWEDLRIVFTVREGSKKREVYTPRLRIRAKERIEIVATCEPGQLPFAPTAISAMATGRDGPPISRSLPPEEYERRLAERKQSVQAQRKALNDQRLEDEAAETKQRLLRIDAEDKQQKQEDAVLARAAAARRAAEKAARARAQIRCSAVWQDTIDRKLADLTVRQVEDVSRCQTLGLYRQSTAAKE